MIMSFRINGQSANLLVDTGASQLILDAAAAESFGIKPSQRNPLWRRVPKEFIQADTFSSRKLTGRTFPSALRKVSLPAA